jgi:hypothetical protein
MCMSQAMSTLLPQQACMACTCPARNPHHVPATLQPVRGYCVQQPAAPAVQHSHAHLAGVELLPIGPLSDTVGAIATPDDCQAFGGVLSVAAVACRHVALVCAHTKATAVGGVSGHVDAAGHTGAESPASLCSRQQQWHRAAQTPVNGTSPFQQSVLSTRHASSRNLLPAGYVIRMPCHRKGHKISPCSCHLGIE